MLKLAALAIDQPVEHFNDHYISCVLAFAVKVTPTSWYDLPLNRYGLVAHLTPQWSEVQMLLRGRSEARPQSELGSGWRLALGRPQSTIVLLLPFNIQGN